MTGTSHDAAKAPADASTSARARPNRVVGLTTVFSSGRNGVLRARP